MAPQPVVTGLSPKEGPPGTRVIIRGEFLGNRPSDVVGLSICGYDCLLSAEWKSPNKIIAHTGPARGKGDIIITTMSGGVGTSTVQFRAYHEMIGPMKESAVWVEESSIKTLAWGRRNMTPLSYINDDPLGLSIESSEKKFLEDIREQFPDGCSDISLDNFSPCWFLLENHYATTFDDLKAGLSYIKRKVESQKEGQLSFLKSNAGSVLDQLDTLITIRTQIQNILSERAILQNLEKTIESAIMLSAKIFHTVLDRREKADSTRAALATLNRHKFLFCLPNSIDKNAIAGEYDLIISDYSRAINLFGKTDISVFRQVFGEINNRIFNIRQKLYKDLLKLPQSVEYQKKLVKTLINLEIQQTGTKSTADSKMSDPGWDAIIARANYLQNTFKTSHNEFTSNNLSCEPLKLGEAHELSNWCIFVEEICNIIICQLPDIWRLGQAYFAGDIRGDIIDPNPSDFKKIILESIEAMCLHLRTVIFSGFDRRGMKQMVPIIWPKNCSASALSHILLQLPQCLQQLRSVYGRFIQLDLPGEALDIIKNFIEEVRLFCLSAYFRRANERVKNLKNVETWTPSVENFPGATSLPSLFEQIIFETLEEVQTYITPELREIDILTENSDGHTEVSQRLHEIIITFCRILETLAYQLNDEDTHTPAVSQLIGFSNAKQNSFINYGSGMQWEQRILCCLANCLYFERFSFNKIQFQLIKFGYPSCDSVVETGKTFVKQLFSNLLETYVEHKSDPLVGTIEPSMYIGHFQWDAVEYIEKLRPYAQECNDNLVGVSFEIVAISPLLLSSVMEPIIQTVAEELARLMSCVRLFSKSGAIQAKIDVLFLSNALQTFSNDIARMHFAEALEAIGPLSDDDQVNVERILKSIESTAKLQIACFVDSGM